MTHARDGRPRTGTIYSETTSDGKHRNEGGLSGAHYVRGVGQVASRKRRWVGEITVDGKRYRFRSTNLSNVQFFIESALAQYGE